MRHGSDVEGQRGWVRPLMVGLLLILLAILVMELNYRGLTPGGPRSAWLWLALLVGLLGIMFLIVATVRR